MDAVEELLKTLDQLARELDRPDLEPDPARSDWGTLADELTRLRGLADERLKPLLRQAVAELGDDPGVERLRGEVAVVMAELAGVLHASGRRDPAARLLQDAIELGVEGPLRDELEGARADMDGYAQLLRGRWHLRAGAFDVADPMLSRARRAVKEPRLKAAFDVALNGPRPLKGAPALFRLNGFGVGLYGHRDTRPDGSYVSTHCISALFIPVWPLGAYRVRDAGHNAYEFFARVPLSPFAKGYRWFAAAAVLLAIVGTAVSSYLSSPGRQASIALEEAQELEAAGERDGAIQAYEAVIANHPYAGPAIAQGASRGLMGLLLGAVETPMTAARADEATRLVRRYQDLPSRAQGGPTATLMVSALETWAEQVGDGDEAATRAQLTLLDLGLSVASEADAARLRERAAAGHRALAEELAEDWPLEALHHYVAAGAWGPAGELARDLSPSLYDDATPDLDAVRDAPEADPALAAHIREVRTTLEGWAADPARTAALLEGDATALQAQHAARPEDQTVTAALADALRAGGDLTGATELLTAIGPPGRMSGRAQVALASCYLQEERIAEADALLSRQVEARLPAFAAASQALETLSDARVESLIARAERGAVPDLNRRLANANEQETQRVVIAYLREELDRDPEIVRLREAVAAESAIVPTALMLGTIKLRRAHGASGEARDALLGEAERLFLAIRNEAEGVPEFHLSLGQVYHRLGRAEEGEQELGALLAEGDLSVSLRVAHAYRELGLEARSREVAEDVFERASAAPDLPVALPGQGDAAPASQTRSSAAFLMGLLSHRMEEEERWLLRANQEDEGVQIRLTQIRAQRAIERGEDREADRLLADVARRYEAQGASDPAALNNAALAHEQRYVTSGDLATIDHALTLLERAVTLLPDNSLLVGNLAEVAAYRGDLEALSGHLDLPVLRLDREGARSLVEELLDGPRAAEVRAALASSRHHARARELTVQEQVLAPQRTRAWQRELHRLGRARDAAGFASLRQRVEQVQGLDTSAYQDALTGERSPEELAREQERLDQAVAVADARLERARRSSAPTRAAALHLSAEARMARAWERRSLEDAAAATAAARGARDAWDGLGARSLAMGLVLEAILAATPGTALVERHEADRRVFGPALLALSASHSDPALTATFAADPRLDEAASLRAATPVDRMGVIDLAIARLADHAGLREATAAVAGDSVMTDWLAISSLMSPDNAGLTLSRSLLEG